MAYNNSTPGYKIPYWSDGELSQGVSNKRAAIIVDSQISGVARLIGGNGIITEGAYTATFSSGSSQIVLVGTAQNYALEAYVEGVYVAQNNTLTWGGITNSTTTYLYAQTIESNIGLAGEISSLAGKRVTTVSNTTGLTPPNAILIGIVTTTTNSISLNTSSTISDNTFSQRPILQPYGLHRTANPIDHPFHSIFNAHLTDNCIRSNNIQPWDGLTSGSGVYSSLSGTGIGPNHLKPQAVTSQALAANLSVSGLQIQQSLTTIRGSTTVLSGTTLTPGFLGTNPLEVVPLQYVQQSYSGLQAEINLLGGISAGQNGRTAITSGLSTVSVVFPTPFSTTPQLMGTPCVEKASTGDDDIFCMNVSSFTNSGLTANLSYFAPNGNYNLHWYAFQP